MRAPRRPGERDAMSGASIPLVPPARTASGSGIRRQTRAKPPSCRLVKLTRQVFKHHGRTIGQDHGPFQNVFQLANIARPVIRDQGFDGLGVEVRDKLVDPLRVQVQEMNGQLEDILAALAQAPVSAGRSR